MCFERNSSCINDFLKKWKCYYSCIALGFCNSNSAVKLEKGTTSKYVFTVSAEMWQSSAQPSLPSVASSGADSLLAESCWSSPRRNPTQMKSVRREVMAGWRHDSAMWGLNSFLINTTLVRCHSSCLSQAGLQSHNSHFDCKQRAWPSVVGIWGWLIVRAGCWKLLLWQYFVLHRMPFHNVISSTPPQTCIMVHSGEILTACQMMFHNWVTSSLVCCFMHSWTGQKEREMKLVSEKSVAALWH